MVDVVVVYAREDAAAIPAALARELKPLSVWWDAELGPGDYRSQLEQHIESAGCVIPVWSIAARESVVLHDEVETAVRAKVPVLPVRIHDAQPPLGRGAMQYVDVLGWDGEDGRQEVITLKKKIERALQGRRAQVQRPWSLTIAPGMQLPLFFFSVSSYEARLRPDEALLALRTFGAPSILVSAYDFVARAESDRARRTEERRIGSMIESLNQCRAAGGLVLLDSGNYERARKDDDEWKRGGFRGALQSAPHDLAFCFDNLKPDRDVSAAIQQVVDSVVADRGRTGAPVLPIMHVPRDRDGAYRTELAPVIALGVARRLNPPLLGIPERELGDGLLARLRTMKTIRDELAKLHRYQPVHVLGTGTPVSIALLTAAGADSFDGLEWCRDAIDGETKQFHHFHLFDFFKYQAEVSPSPVAARAQLDDQVRYTGKVVLHNLGVYTEWLQQLRESVRDGHRLASFLGELLPKGALRQVRLVLKDIL